MERRTGRDIVEQLAADDLTEQAKTAARIPTQREAIDAALAVLNAEDCPYCREGKRRLRRCCP